MIRIIPFEGCDLRALLARGGSETSREVEAAVDEIIADVRARGDQALFDAAARFDGAQLKTLRVPDQELAAAKERIEPALLKTLQKAAANIRRFHEAQKPNDFVLTDRPGVVMGQRCTPLSSVGICVPRSPEAFPSTILMNAIPAAIAGVGRIVLVTAPDRSGRVSDAALAAAELAGVHEVYTVGGAQAVAALAYGTESIAPVDKIVGPGGIYVATAKKKVFGVVGIDMVAGPSEVVVLADGESRADYVAADMLAQAEHDVLAAAVLVTDSEALACAVQTELERQLATLPREAIAREAIEANSRIVLCRDLAEAVTAVNAAAPEHLELCVADPFALLPRIQNAGSIFLGRYAAEALGDYLAGPNHTLPTMGTARFSSPLGVDDFRKRSSFLYYDRAALIQDAPDVARFARCEGLEAHARAALARMIKDNDGENNVR